MERTVSIGSFPLSRALYAPLPARIGLRGELCSCASRFNDPYMRMRGALMSIGDIIVYLIAAVALAALVLLLFSNWRGILQGVLTFALGWALIGVMLLGIGLVGAVGFLGWYYFNDRHMMQKCSTAYERREKAYALPDDYFGRRLREEANTEAKECAEFAAHKEALKVREK
uniref:Uncharacterized protein n=1 Tax=Rhodopseudomonas palustris (strain BisA53) TaxID=316055 RepID=Q07I35_RHOP5